MYRDFLKKTQNLKTTFIAANYKKSELYLKYPKLKLRPKEETGKETILYYINV